MKYYIYTLSCPESKQVRYIGITNDLKTRYSGHIRDLRGKTHKISWIKSLLSKNLKPVIELLEEVDNKEELYRLEEYWIDQFRQWGFNLTNNYGRIGLSDSRKGQNHYNSILTEQDAMGIVKCLIENKMKASDIALKFNTTKAVVYSIKNKQNWKHLTLGLDFTSKTYKTQAKNRRSELKQVKVKQYDLNSKYIASFDSIREACSITGCRYTSISNCINGRYKHACNFIWKKSII